MDAVFFPWTSFSDFPIQVGDLYFNYRLNLLMSYVDVFFSNRSSSSTRWKSSVFIRLFIVIWSYISFISIVFLFEFFVYTFIKNWIMIHDFRHHFWSCIKQFVLLYLDFQFFFIRILFLNYWMIIVFFVVVTKHLVDIIHQNWSDLSHFFFDIRCKDVNENQLNYIDLFMMLFFVDVHRVTIFPWDLDFLSRYVIMTNLN